MAELTVINRRNVKFFLDKNFQGLFLLPQIIFNNSTTKGIMKSKTEVGMENTLGHFQTLTGLVTSYGTSYNPPQSFLGLPMLLLLYTATQGTMEEVSATKRDFDNAGIARRQAFGPVKKLAGRVISVLKAGRAPKEVIEDAEAIKRRMEGRRLSSPADGTLGEDTLPDAPKSVSKAQTGFVNQVKHFSDLLELVSKEPSYQTNVPELQLSSLQERKGVLQAANKQVSDLWSAYKKALNNRDAHFYAEENGLVATAMAVKEYVKSEFDSSSVEYKQVLSLPFRSKQVAVKQITLSAAA